MRIMKPGEPCPSCGAPIRGDLPKWKMLLLSYISEGMSLMGAISAMAEVVEFPPPDAALERQTERYEDNIGNSPENPERVPDGIVDSQAPADEKRAIAQRLKDYRAAHGLGCLAKISQKTAHRKGSRIPEDILREIAAGRAPKMQLLEWRKITMALDAIEKEKSDA